MWRPAPSSGRKRVSGRLGWVCCTLFGRCVRVYLIPILSSQPIKSVMRSPALTFFPTHPDGLSELDLYATSFNDRHENSGSRKQALPPSPGLLYFPPACICLPVYFRTLLPVCVGTSAWIVARVGSLGRLQYLCQGTGTMTRGLQGRDTNEFDGTLCAALARTGRRATGAGTVLCSYPCRKSREGNGSGPLCRFA